MQAHRPSASPHSNRPTPPVSSHWRTAEPSRYRRSTRQTDAASRGIRLKRRLSSCALPRLPRATREDPHHGLSAEYDLSSEIAANGEDTKLLAGQIQVHVPFPTGPCTAIFTLYTASMDHWTEIYGLMSAILQTVSFVDLAEALTEQGRA